MKKQLLWCLTAGGLLLASCSNNKTNTISSAAEAITENSKKLTVFLDSIFDDYLKYDPVRATYLGINTDYDKWTDISDAHNKRMLQKAENNLAKMKSIFQLETLDEQAKVSYKMYEYQVAQQQKTDKWRFHNYAVNQMEGLQSNVPSFLINIHPLKKEKDALAYIARVQGVKALFDQLIEELKIREEMKIVPPKFVFPMVISDCKNVLKGLPFESAGNLSTLLEDFTGKINKLDSISAERKKELIDQLNDVLAASFKPAYEKLITYLSDLEKKANTDDGCWKFPDGAAYYDVALNATTTTELTADEIHEIGLKEVERIHNEMKVIMKKVNFKNDKLQDFFKFMRDDKQFYLSETEDSKKKYMADATTIINNMRNKLDELFITQPKANMIVKAVEPFREQSVAGAFYEEPALDGSRPGTYYINLFRMADQATYQMEALAYHEGIPGHHMQIALAQELKGIPRFRTIGGNTAYLEGWALYSEQLGKEVGFYQDPYSDFGRLAMELFRAARLVIDTGIHKKKWSREKALAWMNENTPNPEGDNKKEIERYIVWPSQATGYKIGMLKIMELREKAKQQLGDKFSLKEFHEVVLTSGAVPMSILEELVNDWVKKKSV